MLDLHQSTSEGACTIDRSRLAHTGAGNTLGQDMLDDTPSGTSRLCKLCAMGPGCVEHWTTWCPVAAALLKLSLNVAGARWWAMHPAEYPPAMMMHLVHQLRQEISSRCTLAPPDASSLMSTVCKIHHAWVAALPGEVRPLRALPFWLPTRSQGQDHEARGKKGRMEREGCGACRGAQTHRI